MSEKPATSIGYDFVIIGSGFGGSVAALRLSEKGYRVLILEAGKRFSAPDFPKSNWNLRRFLFMPWLGMRGIMRMDFFRGLMVLSGAGVGGGSLVYANTLIEPETETFANGTWPGEVGVEHWGEELFAFYKEAKRMLGVTAAPRNFPADEALRTTAEGLGFGESYHPVQVGIFFGQPEKEVDDPYFEGKGPKRSGCNFCGGCMIGCRYGAKNTLDKNYLFLAEKNGANIWPESEVYSIKPRPGNGFSLEIRSPGWRRKRRQINAKKVVVAAGVLGTMKLLLRCRDELGTLPDISDALGTDIRTNSESIIGVRVHGSKTDYSRGIAIASGVNPNRHTKIEPCRYPKGSDLIGLLSVPLLDEDTRMGKILSWIRYFVTNPIKYLKEYIPKGFATETIILLVMQSLDSTLRFRWRRRLITLFKRTLQADYAGSLRPPVHVTEGNQFAKALAERVGGTPGGSVSDALGMSVTAHILGGCPMGKDATRGVIDKDHQVFNYPGLYVVGGAAVPANLGVNPSLTITAMAERAMDKIPAKQATGPDKVAA